MDKHITIQTTQDVNDAIDRCVNIILNHPVPEFFTRMIPRNEDQRADDLKLLRERLAKACREINVRPMGEAYTDYVIRTTLIKQRDHIQDFIYGYLSHLLFNTACPKQESIGQIMEEVKNELQL
jgi:hypothetical protein